MEDQQEAAMMDGVEKEEEEEEEDLEIIIVEMEKILVTGKQTSGTSQSFLNHVSSCSSFSDCGIHHGATILPSFLPTKRIWSFFACHLSLQVGCSIVLSATGMLHCSRTDAT
jgi:hypothetical protein